MVGGSVKNEWKGCESQGVIQDYNGSIFWEWGKTQETLIRIWHFQATYESGTTHISRNSYNLAVTSVFLNVTFPSQHLYRVLLVN